MKVTALIPPANSTTSSLPISALYRYHRNPSPLTSTVGCFTSNFFLSCGRLMSHLAILYSSKTIRGQDNARIHTSNIVQRFFTRYNIDVADHPPYSPDLNPIEHASMLIKRQVTECYPDLQNTSGSVDTVKAQLAEVLPVCWEKILETQFDTLSKSMPDRVQAVIEANAWQTRHKVPLGQVVEGRREGSCSVSRGVTKQ